MFARDHQQCLQIISPAEDTLLGLRDTQGAAQHDVFLFQSHTAAMWRCNGSLVPHITRCDHCRERAALFYIGKLIHIQVGHIALSLGRVKSLTADNNINSKTHLTTALTYKTGEHIQSTTTHIHRCSVCAASCQHVFSTVEGTRCLVLFMFSFTDPTN